MPGSMEISKFLASFKAVAVNLRAKPWVREFVLDIYFFRKSRIGMVGLGILSIYIFTAIFANWIAPYRYDQVDPANKYLPPSLEHLFGTDSLGADIFSRVVHGSRISLTMGLIIVAIGGGVGIFLGLVSGYLGGRVDMAIMRITDIFFAFPILILAMAIAAALGPSLENLLVAASVAYWPSFARIVRGSTLAEKEKEYVEAARALGGGKIRIMFRHVLPNVLSPILVYVTIDMAAAILLTASLSFIGLGARPPTPEWGSMVSKGRALLGTSWWVSTFPGMAIFGAVMAFMLIGDGLRDAFDPRLRR